MRKKNELLRRATATSQELSFVLVDREPRDDFRPRPFEGRNWVVIGECFLFFKSGIKTQRDNLVLGWTHQDVERRVLSYKALSEIRERMKTFWAGMPDDTLDELLDKKTDTLRHEQKTKLGLEAVAFASAFDKSKIISYIYRPFDRRFIYLHERYVNRHAPKLRSVLGTSNAALYAMPYKTGAGPAVVVHALKPDYHAFRGCYGGYAFPLYDRRPGGVGYNLNLCLVRALSLRYRAEVTPEQVFDAIVALLSAPSYTRRFAADLEDAFPHVPFPSELAVFWQAGEVGARIKGLQTFDLQPETRFWTARLEGSPEDRTLTVPKVGRAFLDQGDGFGTIRLNPTLRLERVPTRVWDFAVSGYRVVYRWIEARNGLSLDEVIDEETDETLQRQMLDLVARVAEYLDACEASEPVLEAALTSPLTRDCLQLREAGLL